MDNDYDVIVIGCGPSGLTAGLYCAQAGVKVLGVEKENIGGQLVNIEKIENYPGFAGGISGTKLAEAMAVQAMNYGLTINRTEVVGMEIESRIIKISTTDNDYLAKSVIIASGGQPKRLNVPGEEELTGRGVAYCAVCEGIHFKDKVIAVAGGGDAGVTGALYLAKLASKVLIIEVMPVLGANALLQRRALENPKIEILCNSRIQGIIGNDRVRSIEIMRTDTKEIASLRVEGLLIHVGWEPQGEYLTHVLPIDKEGYILVNEEMGTTLEGVFAAGDIRNKSPKQVTAAVGDGTIAAISALKYLREFF